jgi:hypothetical protein
VHPRIAALLLGSSLLAGCVDAEPTPTGLAALPDPTRDALLQAGATAVELGSDQRPLLVRFAGLPVADAVTTLAQLYAVSADDLALTSTRDDQLGMRHQRFQQLHDGLPVLGAELSIHSDVRGEVVAAVSTLRVVSPAAPPAPRPSPPPRTPGSAHAPRRPTASRTSSISAATPACAASSGCAASRRRSP